MTVVSFKSLGVPGQRMGVPGQRMGVPGQHMGVPGQSKIDGTLFGRQYICSMVQLQVL